MQRFCLLLSAYCFPLAAGACAWCRPRVRAGIYTPTYPANLLVVLLPVAVLLALGVGLFYWDNLRTLLPKGYGKR